MDFWQALNQISDLEFDKVEFWLDESGALKPSEILANQDEFLTRIRDQTRLSPVALALAHEIPAEEFAALCRVSKSLQVTQIVVPSAPLGTPFNSEIDRLKDLASTAATEGIRVALKTERGRLSEDAHTAVELCRAAKGLGIAFDPSYFLGDAAEETLDLIAPHTLHVHLRDSTPQQLQVQVGLGEIDYSRVITQLARENYDRALSIEILPELMELEQRKLELRKLRMLIDSLL